MDVEELVLEYAQEDALIQMKELREVKILLKDVMAAPTSVGVVVLESAVVNAQHLVEAPALEDARTHAEVLVQELVKGRAQILLKENSYQKEDVENVDLLVQENVLDALVVIVVAQENVLDALVDVLLIVVDALVVQDVLEAVQDALDAAEIVMDAQVAVQDAKQDVIMDVQQVVKQLVQTDALQIVLMDVMEKLKMEHIHNKKK